MKNQDFFANLEKILNTNKLKRNCVLNFVLQML